MAEVSGDVTKDILSEIERLSSLFMSPKEIAFFLKIDFKHFMISLKNPESEIYMSYTQGKLKSKIELRENIIKLAKQGSPHAQEITVEFIKNQNTAENL